MRVPIVLNPTRIWRLPWKGEGAYKDSFQMGMSVELLILNLDNSLLVWRILVTLIPCMIEELWSQSYGGLCMELPHPTFKAWL